eukprot:6802084-Pyramimonas_sp.AAC.1
MTRARHRRLIPPLENSNLAPICYGRRMSVSSPTNSGADNDADGALTVAPAGADNGTDGR